MPTIPFDPDAFMNAEGDENGAFSGAEDFCYECELGIDEGMFWDELDWLWDSSEEASWEDWGTAELSAQRLH